MRTDGLLARVVAQNEPAIAEAGRLRYFAASRATVLAGSPTDLHQLCQIQFAKDGSIYVHFEYFEQAQGIVTHVRFPEPLRGAVHGMQVAMRENGRFTSHRVKFTHHVDGEAHFSKDTKVYTEVRRLSFRLDESIGTVFQLNAYHLAAFSRLERLKRKRAHLTYLFPDPLPDALMVVAEWRRASDVLANAEAPGGRVGPVAEVFRRSNGDHFKAALYGPPPGEPIKDRLLMVSCTPIPVASGVTRPTMLFIGGMDSNEIRVGEDPRAQTGLLAFLYPASSDKEVRKLVGTIDLPSHLA